VSTALSKSQKQNKSLLEKYKQLRDKHSKHEDAHHMKYVKNVVLRFLALHASQDTSKCLNLIPLLAEMLDMTEAERKTLTLSLHAVT